MSGPLCMHASRSVLFALVALGTVSAASAQPWQSEIVFEGEDGRLVYVSDAEGNRVPDFSDAGYRGGGVALPAVPTVRTVTPVEGDDTASIQAAIDEVEALDPDASGIRGAVELAAGTFEVAGTLTIDESGVVLRGAGDGDDAATSTVLLRSGENQDPIIYVGRVNSASGDALIRRVQGRASTDIVSDVVPIGARSFEVQNPERLRAGLPVVVYHPATAAWVAAVDGGATATDPAWDEGDHPIAFARTVTAVEGSTVTVDAPVFYPLDRAVSPSYVYWRDASGVIEEVGVEDLRIEIETQNQFDESQARNALVFALVENGWVTGVTARHFWHAGVSIQNARYVTVRDCQALEPHSFVDGERRYNFEVEKSQLVLFEGNRATDARHAYVGNGQTLDSGIVFLNNTSENATTSSEAHRQWGTGFLFDNHTELGSDGTSTSDRRIHLGNRGSLGTAHGWACANCVVWNAEMNGALVIVEKPPTAQNYAIGVQGPVTNDGPFLRNTDAYIEGTDRAGLEPQSLYLRQLEDRRAVSGEPGTPDAPGVRLFAAAPNPARGPSRIGFALSDAGRVRLVVYDVLGREVAVLADGRYGGGEHSVTLDGRTLAAGLYVYRLTVTANGRTHAATNRLTLTR